MLDTFQPDKMAIREVNMSSKRYTEEFKIEAVRQVVENPVGLAVLPDYSGNGFD